jgi:hypothetical protein
MIAAGTQPGKRDKSRKKFTSIAYGEMEYG